MTSLPRHPLAKTHSVCLKGHGKATSAYRSLRSQARVLRSKLGSIQTQKSGRHFTLRMKHVRKTTKKRMAIAAPQQDRLASSVCHDQFLHVPNDSESSPHPSMPQLISPVHSQCSLSPTEVFSQEVLDSPQNADVNLGSLLSNDVYAALRRSKPEHIVVCTPMPGPRRKSGDLMWSPPAAKKAFAMSSQKTVSEASPIELTAKTFVSPIVPRMLFSEEPVADCAERETHSDEWQRAPRNSSGANPADSTLENVYVPFLSSDMVFLPDVGDFDKIVDDTVDELPSDEYANSLGCAVEARISKRTQCCVDHFGLDVMRGCSVSETASACIEVPEESGSAFTFSTVHVSPQAFRGQTQLSNTEASL